MKKQAASIFSVFCIALAFSIFSCNKGEQFLGETEFGTTVEVKTFTTAPSTSIDVTIDDSTWENITVAGSGSLQNIFTKHFSVPASGKSHIVIRWNDTLSVIDTTITLKSINSYYLIQFNPDIKPAFYTSFGESVATPPAPGFIKGRFYYKRSELDMTPWPDSVKIEFVKLVGTTSNYYEVPDTSMVIYDGVVSSYLPLPDSRKITAQDPEVTLGYRIKDAKTGAILQDFCFGMFQFGVIQLNSNVGGLYQTTSFDYYEPDPGVPGCDFGSPVEMYKLKLLFGSK